MEEALAQLSRVLDWIQELAPGVWAIYLRQQYARGSVDIVFGALSLAVVIGCFMAAKKAFVLKDLPDNYDRERYDGAVVLCVIVGCIAAFAAACLLYSGPTRLLSPGYHAIKDLLSVVK